MYMLFKDGKERAVTLSYDDGVIYDQKLIEILDKYGLKATFNVNSGLWERDAEERDKKPFKRMTLDEAKKLYIGSGHEVAVHALTHPWLEQMDSTEVVREITEDRKNIERDFGTIARGMAYPFGTYNQTVIDALKACGICYSRTIKYTNNFKLPENWLELHPTCHHSYPRLMELAGDFVNKYNGICRLFYLWGHSYEFNNQNNWEVIEEFAKFIGGRDNIWYATNIEIYDYHMAYKNLVMSYDKKMIYNPSAIDVWVYDNITNEKLKIKAGETLVR